MTLAVAASLPDALERLAADPSLRPMAGGVGVMLARALGETRAERWLAVAQLPELRQSAVGDDGEIKLGAALTLDELTRPGSARSVPPLLAAAVRATANPGIRNVATLGGNLVGAGGSSDPLAALVALGATAEVVARDRVRLVPVEEVATVGVGAGELVRAFRLPAVRAYGWERLTTRGAMDTSAATVAIAATRGGWRAVVTFVADRPLRLPTTEAVIRSVASEAEAEGEAGEAGGAREAGRAGEAAAAVREAAAHDLGRLDLLTDVRATATYRRRVVPVLVERAALQASRPVGRVRSR